MVNAQKTRHHQTLHICSALAVFEAAARPGRASKTCFVVTQLPSLSAAFAKGSSITTVGSRGRRQRPWQDCELLILRAQVPSNSSPKLLCNQRQQTLPGKEALTRNCMEFGSCVCRCMPQASLSDLRRKPQSIDENLAFVLAGFLALLQCAVLL